MIWSHQILHKLHFSSPVNEGRSASQTPQLHYGDRILSHLSFLSRCLISGDAEDSLIHLLIRFVFTICWSAISSSHRMRGSIVSTWTGQQSHLLCTYRTIHTVTIDFSVFSKELGKTQATTSISTVSTFYFGFMMAEFSYGVWSIESVM